MLITWTTALVASGIFLNTLVSAVATPRNPTPKVGDGSPKDEIIPNKDHIGDGSRRRSRMLRRSDGIAGKNVCNSFLYAYEVSVLPALPGEDRRFMSIHRTYGCITASGNLKVGPDENCMIVSVSMQEATKKASIRQFRSSARGRQPLWYFLSRMNTLTSAASLDGPKDSGLIWEESQSLLGAQIDGNEVYRWEPYTRLGLVEIKPDPEGRLLVIGAPLVEDTEGSSQ
ncbi:MAG: hypothetical protein M1829_000090 [Trizodia sp. TS-e1964]|nr:MAG: hypothetical protein M1829_000090 [Trizodia sp. TS-e1964]